MVNVVETKEMVKAVIVVSTKRIVGVITATEIIIVIVVEIVIVYYVEKTNDVTFKKLVIVAEIHIDVIKVVEVEVKIEIDEEIY